MEPRKVAPVPFAVAAACLALLLALNRLSGLGHLSTLMLIVPALAYAALDRKLSPRRASVEYLLEDPQDRNVCPVAICIVRQGRIVGHDRGAAWFQNGTLHYSGERTSFIVGGENVLPQSRWSVFHNGEGPGLPPFALPLCIDDVPTYVSFQPLDHADRGASYGQKILFMRRLAPLRDRPVPGHGPRQWPPIEP